MRLRLAVSVAAAAALAVVTLISCAAYSALEPSPDKPPTAGPGNPTRSALPDLTETADVRRLSDAVGHYPRVIRLAHSGKHNGTILASTVSFIPGEEGGGVQGVGIIHESTDGGASFTEVGRITEPAAADGRGLCCGTLFEVPAQLGDTPPGTLLWAASTGNDVEENRRMRIRVWRSVDRGRTWSYLSDCAAASNGRGLWEPEFSVDQAGRLVCHYADETQYPRHSQTIARAVSTDGGRTWQQRQNTITGKTPRDRPGMPNVRRLPNGTYLMSYELCAVRMTSCGVFLRSSPDGWNWGSPTEFGWRAETADGKYFRRAPTITWTPRGGPNGSILLIGQRLHHRNGAPAAESGKAIFVNSQNGRGPWREVSAPVPVEVPGDVRCQNISSSVLSSTDGTSILQIATDRVEGDCRAFYRVAPLASLAPGG